MAQSSVLFPASFGPNMITRPALSARSISRVAIAPYFSREMRSNFMAGLTTAQELLWPVHAPSLRRTLSKRPQANPGAQLPET